MQLLTLDAQIILATSYFIFPVIFSLLLSLLFFTSIFSFFLFFFFFFFFFLWILVYFSADRFSVWVFKPFFLTFPSCEAQMFLLMLMVHPFDVLNILIGHIVFYRFVIGGAYYGTNSLSFTTSFAVHIFCSIYSSSFFHQFKGFFGTNIETSSNWRVSSVGKALRRYCKDHGFKSRTGLYAFF